MVRGYNFYILICNCYTNGVQILISQFVLEEIYPKTKEREFVTAIHTANINFTF